jgi:serine/threonine protein kinase
MRCPKCNFNNTQDARFCGHCASPLPLEDRAPLFRTETLQTPVSELPLGATFSGRYYIIRELGRGGMGKVYEALDKDLEERVALKIIRPDIAAHEQIIQRFRNELKLARKIVHKNVCRMFDLNKDGEIHYITMEYVPGEDLKSTLCRIGPLSLAKALDIARQVCDGLAEAHRLGVIHRDLKPQNLMIDDKGNVRIMDFGIAHSLEAKGITEDGHVVGTMEYMSPEQVEGKKADERSDIYSVGVILYEMSTGRTPFEGNTPFSVAAKHLSTVPVEPRIINAQIPPSLSQIIMKCLEKDQEKRFQKATELLDEIEKAQKSLPTTDKITLERKPLPSKEISAGRKRAKLLIPVLAVIATMLVVLGLRQFVFRSAKTTPPSLPPVSAPEENLLETGKKYWQEKKYSEALDEFEKLLAREPGNPEAHFSLASVLKEQGRIDEAIVELEKTVSLESSDPRPYKSLGEIYEQRQDPGKSLRYYKEYLEKAPAGSDSQRIRQSVKELEARSQVLPRTEAKPVPLPDMKKPEQDVQDVSVDISEGIEAYNKGNYDLCIQRMEAALKGDPGNSKARSYLKDASAKKAEELKEMRIREGIQASQKAFEDKAYQKCIEEAKAVLELDQNSAEARKYFNLARMQVIPQEIQAVVNQYVKKFNDKEMLSFYQETCSPDLYQKIKNDVGLIMSTYSDWQAAVSDLSIRFEDINKVEASFSIVSTAVLKKDGQKQVLYEGVYVWDMEYQGDRWTIMNITAKPAKKDQETKEHL